MGLPGGAASVLWGWILPKHMLRAKGCVGTGFVAPRPQLSTAAAPLCWGGGSVEAGQLFFLGLPYQKGQNLHGNRRQWGCWQL